MIVRQIMFSAISTAVLSSAAFAQDEKSSDKGMLEFNNACRTCHSVDAGDNRLGPNLNQIVGRQAGAADGFQYSPALKNSKISWTEDNLDKFIANPEQFLPGNSMKPFAGIDDADSRKAIIGYLRGQK